MNFKALAILVTLVSALYAQNSHSAGLCASAIGGKKSLLASDMTKEVLATLVGSQISYTGKYVFQDPTDSRVISGKGFVEAVQLWADQGNSSFSIRFREDNGNKFTVQALSRDTSFKLVVKSESAMEKFEKAASADGLTVQRVKFHDSMVLRADFFNDPKNQMLRFAVVKATNDPLNPFTIEQIDSTSTKVPSALEIAMNEVQGKPVILELHTAQGLRQIKYSDILAIAK